MAIFGGPIDNAKAKQLIVNNMEVIVNTVDNYIEGEFGAKSPITGKPLSEVLWNNIALAGKEIPHYIFFENLNVPLKYPYDYPSEFVACAIYYKYSSMDTSTDIGKKEKKELSKAISGIKDGRLQSEIHTQMRVYIDNIKTSIIKPRRKDDIDRIAQKETSINFLAQVLSVYETLFGALEEYNTAEFEAEKRAIEEEEREKANARVIARQINAQNNKDRSVNVDVHGSGQNNNGPTRKRF